MSTDIGKVYQAICNVIGDLAKVGIAKERRNQQQGYSFRGIDDVYSALSSLLATHRLVMLPRAISRATQDRPTKDGKGVLIYTVLEVEFDLVSAEDGSKHTVKTYGEAMDSGDKGSNKAQSAAYKYAALMAFCIPTEGDNDTENQTHEVRSLVGSDIGKIGGIQRHSPNSQDAAHEVSRRKLKEMKSGKTYEDVSKEIAMDYPYSSPEDDQERGRISGLVIKAEEALKAAGCMQEKMSKPERSAFVRKYFGCSWSQVPGLPAENIEDGIRKIGEDVIKASRPLEEQLRVPPGFPSPWNKFKFRDGMEAMKEHLMQIRGDEAGLADYRAILRSIPAPTEKCNDPVFDNPGPAMRAWSGLHKTIQTAEAMQQA